MFTQLAANILLTYSVSEVLTLQQTFVKCLPLISTDWQKEEKSGIPQCFASNYIINSMLIRDLAFEMGLLGVNADLPSPLPLLYVNCLDLDSQSYVNLSNLACCRFLTVMGHVSFPKDLRERLLCLSL